MFRCRDRAERVTSAQVTAARLALCHIDQASRCTQRCCSLTGEDPARCGSDTAGAVWFAVTLSGTGASLHQQKQRVLQSRDAQTKRLRPDAASRQVCGCRAPAVQPFSPPDGGQTLSRWPRSNRVCRPRCSGLHITTYGGGLRYCTRLHAVAGRFCMICGLARSFLFTCISSTGWLP